MGRTMTTADHIRPYPRLYRYADMGLLVYARYGRELCRILGGRPDDPKALEQSRRGLLASLQTLAKRKARGPAEVICVLLLADKKEEAAVVRQLRGVEGGLSMLANEAKRGDMDRRACLKWAYRRIAG